MQGLICSTRLPGGAIPGTAFLRVIYWRQKAVNQVADDPQERGMAEVVYANRKADSVVKFDDCRFES